MILEFIRILAAVEVRVHAEFYQAKCSGSWRDRGNGLRVKSRQTNEQSKLNNDAENNTVMAIADSNDETILRTSKSDLLECRGVFLCGTVSLCAADAEHGRW